MSDLLQKVTDQSLGGHYFSESFKKKFLKIFILIKKHSQNYLTDSHEILSSQTTPLDPSRRKVSSLRLLPFKSYDGEKKFKSSLVSYVTSSFISGSILFLKKTANFHDPNLDVVDQLSV